MEEEVESDECAICLNTIDKSTNFSITDCGHRFHCSCLIKASIKKRQCPMCRADLLKEEENEEERERERVRSRDNRVYIFNGQFPLLVDQLRQIFDNTLEDLHLGEQGRLINDEIQQEPSGEYNDDEDEDDNDTIFQDLQNLLPLTDFSIDLLNDFEADTDFEIDENDETSSGSDDV
jgi:uncharacterized protein YbaR (Trm112 family)